MRRILNNLIELIDQSILLKVFFRSSYPGRRAWKGAGLGVFAAAFTLFAFTSYFVLPVISLPGILAVVTGASIAVLSGLVFAIILFFIKLIPFYYCWASATLFIVLCLSVASWPSLRLFLTIALFIFIPFSLIGASLYVLSSPNLRYKPLKQRVISMTGFTLGICMLVAGILWFLNEGSFEVQKFPVQNNFSTHADIALEDPSAFGDYRVLELNYGSGRDRHRSAFAEKADLITKSVNGTEFVKNWDGLSGWARSFFWDFDPSELPVNGRVQYPNGKGPYSLVLMVHGNHLAEIFSDEGYAYLGRLLASRGFIFVSVDENFLNSSAIDILGGINGGLQNENILRGWLLLEHLRQWQHWNMTPDNPFYKKVDMENIALIGHSKGGEAVAIAAMLNRLTRHPDNAKIRLDYGFSIKSLMTIAPADCQYLPLKSKIILEDINYFTIHGSLDGNLPSFVGTCQFDRIKFSGNGSFFKSALLIKNANHSQFNRKWGRTDLFGFKNSLLNLRQILPDTVQEHISMVFVSAYLEATLLGKSEYIMLFKDWRSCLEWLPESYFICQFEMSCDRFFCKYEEDFDVTTGTLPGVQIDCINMSTWREQTVQLKSIFRDTRAVYIGWNNQNNAKPTVYSITLPNNSFSFSSISYLIFSAADADDKSISLINSNCIKDYYFNNNKTNAIDFSIEMIDDKDNKARIRLSDYIILRNQFKEKILKDLLPRRHISSEPLFQSYSVPLIDFLNNNKELSLSSIKSIRFVFDLTPIGTIILDNIGYR